MQSKQPSFFPKEQEKKPLRIQFLNLIKTPSGITELYRGFDNLQSVVFGLPTLLTGVFGKTFPEVISIEDVKLHKLTNLSNDYHMVSMSENLHIAYDWGNGNYITIDPTLFREFSVDVHASYRNNNLNLPGKMEKELEHLALAVPYICIKNIIINNKVIPNPFYLAIPSNNQEAIQEFSVIYIQFVTMLNNKYTRDLNEAEEQSSLREFVTNYLNYYDRYSGKSNPFNKTLKELSELHPEFMKHFLQLNPQSSMTESMRNISVSASEGLLKKHFYTQSIDASFLQRNKIATTCLEDEWARPMFD